MQQEIVKVTRSYHIQYPDEPTKTQLLNMLQSQHLQHFAGPNGVSARVVNRGELQEFNPEELWAKHIQLTELLDSMYSINAHYTAAQIMQVLFGINTATFKAFKDFIKQLQEIK